MSIDIKVPDHLKTQIENVKTCCYRVLENEVVPLDFLHVMASGLEITAKNLRFQCELTNTAVEEIEKSIKKNNVRQISEFNESKDK